MILRFEKDKKEEGKEKSKETEGKKNKASHEKFSSKKMFLWLSLGFCFCFFHFSLENFEQI